MLPPFVYLCFMLTAVPVALDPLHVAIAAELSHPAFEKRRATMAALDAIGEPALPALRKVLLQTDDPEAAERASQLLQTISARIDNSRRIAPTLVELNAVNVKAVAVYAELEKQTGFQFTVTHVQFQATGPIASFQSVTFLTFRGSCQKDVLVPFTLTDIAVAPGTNTLPAKNE